MELTWTQWFWVSQYGLLAIGVVYTALTKRIVDKSAGEPDLGSGTTTKLAFYQFRKRIHHFYFVGLIWTAWITWTVFAAYCLDYHPGQHTSDAIHWATEPKIPASESTGVLLGCVFYLIHLVRRLWEIAHVSIFSRRQLFNPIEVLLNFAFYIFAAFSLIAHAPAFELIDGCLSYSSIRWFSLVGVVIYIGASIHQNRAHWILARLRRNRAGHIVSTAYRVPKGDWFDYVSCPHYLSECLIYVSIGLVMGMNNATWWALTDYVILNQIYMAYHTHMWYKKKFDDYPTTRKMIIPFIL